MRHLALLVPTILVVAACSSDDDDGCPFVGTYTATAELESGDCPATDNAQPVTDTISSLGDNRYQLEVQGIGGGCVLEDVGSCKLQGKCDATITDALNPNDRGTVQYSWTFTKEGFTGFSAITVPPAKSVPEGCSATARVTGTRR